MSRVWPGSPYPQGASWDGEGVNFALYSEHAHAVELCIYREPGDAVEKERIQMVDRTDRMFHCYLPDARPGLLYAFRVHGSYRPEDGLRFNHHKLLLDPYARAITGDVRWDDSLFGYRIGEPDMDLSYDSRNSAGYMPKCVVVDESFPWGEDRAPRVPWHRTVIYEAHVRGLTMRHPDVPPEHRGTYLGLASDAIIEHLRSLSVTAIELMPVHHFISHRHLEEAGLTNYWGYDTIGFFAPDPWYATGGDGRQVSEFKSMVKRLHRAGIEVILDVVYNHTGEGNELGPTLAFRGIDNPSYYRVSPQDRRYYVDFTGCGNSLNVLDPQTMRLIMDSLRYWVQEMHVDGFRFDLAAALARELYHVNRLHRFFDIVRQDPVISRVKLIAEPWDLGEGGYQVGNFPVGWVEWNGKYRDTVRRFWRGDPGQAADMAYRLSGSSDLYDDRRTPHASINFVTCHDGFTLRDLVSYEQKHNELNGEDNRDGTDANFSRNWGVEGPTEEVGIVRMREQMIRNFAATLAFSQGVPMISHGDELGRTQRGNNNAYCQDSELTWVDWDVDPRTRRILRFFQEVFAIRASNPVLRRRSFFRGHPVGPRGVKDLAWVRPDGQEMTQQDWNNPRQFALGVLLYGRHTTERDEQGRLAEGETVLLLINGGGRSRRFTLPRLAEPGHWVERVNTARPPGSRMIRTSAINLIARSLVLFSHETHR